MATFVGWMGQVISEEHEAEWQIKKASDFGKIQTLDTEVCDQTR